MLCHQRDLGHGIGPLGDSVSTFVELEDTRLHGNLTAVSLSLLTAMRGPERCLVHLTTV